MLKITEYFRTVLSDDQRVFALRTWRVFQALLIAAVLFGSGWSTGYWIRDNMAFERRLAMESKHQKELKEKADEYAKSLEVIGQAVNYASGKVAATAAAVEQITQTSEAAANTAQKAANTAQKAAAQSAVALTKAQQVPEPTREQINRSVERANRNIKP